jgi:16S rRNA (cytosine1402-N4)-methyltransferase
MNKDYHIPVLLQESLDGLAIKPSGVYVDLTFGGGGHSMEILKRLDENGKLIVFDTDKDAFSNLQDDKRIIPIKANFRYFINFLRLHGLLPVDGILADLGVSSYQFDKADKGFTYREDAPLDMRMNREASLSAYDVINSYSQEELRKVLNKYGEIYRPAYAIALAIVNYRKHKPIETTGELVKVVDKAVSGKATPGFLSQLFQAIRIEVNDELGALREMLSKTPYALRAGGRLVVITYHSLEDKTVKYFMKYGTFDKPEYGNETKSADFKIVNKKVIKASKEEIARNRRSRSAKLRIAERI